MNSARTAIPDETERPQAASCNSGNDAGVALYGAVVCPISKLKVDWFQLKSGARVGSLTQVTAFCGPCEGTNTVFTVGFSIASPRNCPPTE